MTAPSNKAFVVVDGTQYRLVTVQGDVDGVSVVEFRLACASRLPLVVDLLWCSYIDSSGLNVLIARNRSGNVALVLTPGSRVYRIFEITRLLDHFRIAATTTEAVFLAVGSPDRKPIIEDPDY